ncbi:Type I restriction-modification system methyltransferase subunit [Thiorhodovibrio winogradskyi]|uniref:site-specific DNA-methyltransferase (adenine-specific) n=1 Tax=Thiorhodovibrio winogradskyi TaxID=77007 RepID=A0ABZ0SHD0_9GAMM|nr:BREX-1 system adenine-specific DNA-methyltransferase PglX [Thiorhodovibrio winogradskyi]
MDKSTRNAIQNATQAARQLLEDAYREQLEGTYDILPDGRIAAQPGSHLSERQQLLRERLVAVLAHKRSVGLSAKEAVADYLRDAAFTTFNRFVALKMLEARGLVQECVSKGEDSSGFKEFGALTPGLVAIADKGYRLYLESLFDELSRGLKVLFDRQDVASLLWPDRQTLLDLLAILNTPELAEVWDADETIGWVYQYWNSVEERKAMRDAAAAPRNSRELAVRNQFFTPRYVVEFLTDNTLGRIWYEMTQGETRLTEQCRYLVRRPTEIFLREGEQAPEQVEQGDEPLSQEALLRQPVYIPHRPLKDPRDILLLDPACGSMHFGLYAFDLFEIIYEEAWDRGDCPALREDFESKEAFLREVPQLIIEHNIHGVDIDPRAVQIAALSLWLRAQKSWRDLPPGERPEIRRTNIVCAEPMPGDRAMLDDFVQQLEPPLLGELVKTVFERMQLAGEAGTLLKIEEEIRTAIEDARQEAERQRGDLFGSIEVADADFFATAEARIYAALQAYAESAEAGDYRRRLFTEDAAQGFAFIDVCRKRYDVVVMNPPFGAVSVESREYLYQVLASAPQDLFAAFVERFSRKLLEGGRLGIISSRLALFKELLAEWRYHFLLGGDTQLAVVGDLGYGVLDGAVVEAAAYVVERPTQVPIKQIGLFFSALDTESKDNALVNSINEIFVGNRHERVFVHVFSSFLSLPSNIIAYWCSAAWLTRISTWKNAGNSGVVAKRGLETGNHFRFLRLCWEVPATNIAPFQYWTFYSKGGEYRPAHSDLHLVFNWKLREFARRVSNEGLYGRAGLTYTERTTSNFASRVMPARCVFSPAGPGVFPARDEHLHGLLGFLNSSIVGFYIELFVGGGDTSAPGTAARHFSSTFIERLPVPRTFDALLTEIGSITHDYHKQLQGLNWSETSPEFFIRPFCNKSLRAELLCRLRDYERSVVAAIDKFRQLDDVVSRAYDLGTEEREDIIRSFERIWYTGISVSDNTRKEILNSFLSEEVTPEEDDSYELGQNRATTKLSFVADRRYEAVATRFKISPQLVASIRQEAEALPQHDLTTLSNDMICMSVGCVFGRWDIRYATGERQPPELPDPFDPLPVCPPGMLQNADGLPAAPEDIPADYPLRITWSGILVDDPGHPDDIVTRVREALTVIWGERAAAIEQEACEILGIKQLRDYFAEKKAGSPFFKDHLSRYSKSRRQAPIYWPLSTASGSYSFWVYYHRFEPNTFYSLLRLAGDKLGFEERKLAELTQEAGPDPTAKQRKVIDAQDSFVSELRGFITELNRIAPLWKPNLNDGVIINSAPVWRLLRNSTWQKKVKECWDKLAKGDYDWAHLAMHLWPERVVPKCQTDRSLAIAHGLEDAFWLEADDGKWQPRPISQAEIDALIAERTSTAVKAALEDLLSAPAPSGASRRKKRSTG